MRQLIRHGQAAITGLNPHQGNKRFIVSHRGKKGGGEGPPTADDYLLSANFNSTDGAIATGDLETQKAGSVQQGALAAVVSTGTAEILTQKIRHTGGTGWHTNYLNEPTAVTVVVGIMAKVILQSASLATNGPFFVFQQEGVAATDNTFTYGLLQHTTGDIRFILYNSSNASASTLLFTDSFPYLVDTPYEVAMVLGGFNTAGAPYISGETVADFGFGCSVFIKTAGNWRLINRDPRFNYGTLHLRYNNQTSDALADDMVMAKSSAALVSTFDPDLLSRFVAPNGTALGSYTPELGAWTVVNGTWEIQSNKLIESQTGVDDNFIVTQETGKTDYYIRAAVTIGGTNGTNRSAPLVMFRYQDASNHWYVGAANAGTASILTEVVAGSGTTRGTISGNIPADTEYYISVSDDGDIIRHSHNLSSTEVSFTSTLFGTETRVGIRTRVQGAFVTPGGVSNYVVYPVSSAKYAAIDTYPALPS